MTKKVNLHSPVILVQSWKICMIFFSRLLNKVSINNYNFLIRQLQKLKMNFSHCFNFFFHGFTLLVFEESLKKKSHWSQARIMQTRVLKVSDHLIFFFFGWQLIWFQSQNMQKPVKKSIALRNSQIWQISMIMKQSISKTYFVQ